MSTVTAVAPLAADERAALLDLVREFTEAALAPHAGEWDEHHHFPVDVLRDAGGIGLGGVYAREEFGGSALSRLDAAAVFEELSRGDTTIAAYISIHNMVVWMIDAFGDDAQRARWLPRLVTLDDRASYCLSEPGSGSDAGALSTSARLDGDAYVLNGVKQFISGAGSSAVYLVMARTGGSGSRGVTAFLLPGDAPGLSFGPEEQKLGWNAQPTRQVILDDVRVPVADRLGDEGQGFPIAMRGLNGARVNMAACSLGGAQWALERAATYVQEREAFGAPLSANQSVVFTLADMATDLAAARLLIERAATKMDEGAADVAVACAMAKRFATDAAHDVADAALQLFGGYGLLRDYGIERVVRDLRVHRITEGTNEIMRLIVGREVLRTAR